MGSTTSAPAAVLFHRPMPSNAPAIRNCESFAATNHGVVPRHIAFEEGLDRSAISRLITSGRWKNPFPRAYLVAGAPCDWRAQLALVEASVVDGFAFSHRTAGALLGLDGIKRGALEISTRRRIELRGVTIHRLRRPLGRTVRVDGLPVTSGPHTVMDLFSVVPSKTAELALEDALRKRVTSIDRQWSDYQDCCNKGRGGCKALRLALLRRDHIDGTLASRMEAKLRLILKLVPGDASVPQFPVSTPNANYRIDFASPKSNSESKLKASIGTWAKSSGLRTSSATVNSRSLGGHSSITRGITYLIARRSPARSSNSARNSRTFSSRPVSLRIPRQTWTRRLFFASHGGAGYYCSAY